MCILSWLLWGALSRVAWAEAPTASGIFRYRAAWDSKVTDRQIDKQLTQGKHWLEHSPVWALKPGQQEAGAWLQG